MEGVARHHAARTTAEEEEEEVLPIIFVWMVVVFWWDLLSGPVHLQATQTPARECWWERAAGRESRLPRALQACAQAQFV